MKKYIKVYDNVLPEEHCKTLIDKFELNKDQHIHRFDNHDILQKLISINTKI